MLLYKNSMEQGVAIFHSESSENDSAIPLPDFLQPLLNKPEKKDKQPGKNEIVFPG